jgi:predicted ATPase/class 3 adenylate cyclase
MLSVAGHQVLQPLSEGRSTAVYRALRLADSRPVIIKVLRQPYPPPAVLARFRREYELLRTLALPGIIETYGLAESEHVWMIFLEDFGGTSLDRLVVSGPLPIPHVLDIGIRVAEILGQLHDRGIIHKDLTPGNVVFNAATGQVKVIDFGISTQLSQESPDFRNPGEVEGTLAYISPEQTGRMNRYVDYRSDFYSLGATLYHVLTGQLPFTEHDPLALVHCHIARQPLAPHLRHEGVPEALSDIVMKLMSKDVEARYQSAAGLRLDLERCAAEWRERKAIQRFDLGQRDRPARFRVPQRLYAREAEVEQLLQAFGRVAVGAAETLLVSGPAGIGKSVLVQEVYRPITGSRGYFTSGKFDQLRRNTPYAPLLEAFHKLIRELLTESTAALTLWRERLSRALGPNGALVVEVIPELELILGPQQPVPALPPAEAQNRFVLVLLNFVRAFASVEHPLVVFIDDLQWADAASLEFIQRLMTASDTAYTFFIGAYRDEQVHDAHPVALLREALGKAGARLGECHLGPLGVKPLVELLGDTLGAEPAEVEPLAQLVHGKTHGNPFFVNTFLTELHRNQQLRYDPERGSWTWDLNAIASLAITDNVVELVADRVRHLPPAAQRVLELAACIGNRFDLATLALIHERTPRETARDLWECVAAGMVLPLGDAYQWIQMEVPGLEDALKVEYRFAHDRVQQAAYSLIGVTARPAMHRRIGEQLLRSIPVAERPQNIFDIVDQLNRAVDEIAGAAGEKAREELAELNLLAARRAKDAAAFAAALSYARTALGLLPVDLWEKRYDLALQLHELAAEGAFLTSAFDAMTGYVDAVVAHARDVLDVQRVYEIKIQALGLQDRLSEAIDTALGLLAQLGVRFPAQPSVPHILAGMGRAWWALRGKSPEALAELGEMTDPRQRLAIRIMFAVAAPAVFARPKLLPLLTCEEIITSVRHGNGPETGLVYGSWAVIRIGFIGDVADGLRFTRLAEVVHERYGSAANQVRFCFTLNVLLRHWREHLRESLPRLLDGVQKGLDTGDYEYGAHCARFYCYYLFAAGEDLDRVRREMERYGRLIVDMKQPFTLRGHTMWQQSVINLMGESPGSSESPASGSPLQLIGTVYDEREVVPQLLEAKNGNTLCDYHMHKLLLALLFGDPEGAASHADQADSYLESQICTFTTVLVTFYGALARLGLLSKTGDGDGLPPQRVRSLRKRIGQAKKKLALWAEHAPMTFRHRYLLVAAEDARTHGDTEEARQLYDQAIDAAREHRWLNDEALACELAGRFYLETAQPRVAAFYMHEARYAYQRWGARAKVRDLEARYAQLRLHINPGPGAGAGDDAQNPVRTQVSTTITTTGRSTGAALDLSSVLRASQALSGEIVLEQLLSALMRIVLENAGAQRGWLVLPRSQDGAWVIAATGEVDDTGATVARALGASGPTAGPEDLPLTLIQYVARTLESVVLDDASSLGPHARDPYVALRKPRSILCAPLIKQGRLVGAVYLENNLTHNAFTPARLQVIDLLSSQAAVSIENATLYGQQMALTRAYSRFVPREFLKYLEKESILEVALGDQVQREMSILFADIRDFTTLSEQMTPKETFDFINELLRRIGPVMRQHGGFIDKYIGDAIMALFPHTADDSVRAAVALHQELERLNEERTARSLAPIRMGAGVHTGSLMLGTIGETERMENTVISDAVNTASRIESLTKSYRVTVLISEDTRARLSDPSRFAHRFVDEVAVKGRQKKVAVYEVFEADPAHLKELKQKTRADFEAGAQAYRAGEFATTAELMRRVLAVNPDDPVARLYLERSTEPAQITAKTAPAK